MQAFLYTLLSNAGAMALRWSFIKWALKSFARTTKTQLDDNAVELIDALHRGDVPAFKEIADKILDELVESER